MRANDVVKGGGELLIGQSRIKVFDMIAAAKTSVEKGVLNRDFGIGGLII